MLVSNLLFKEITIENNSINIGYNSINFVYFILIWIFTPAIIVTKRGNYAELNL